jgi:hypothetical protein
LKISNSLAMEGFTYDPSMDQSYSDDKKALEEGQVFYEEIDVSLMSKSQLAHLRESPAARERRLARNAERMREKRAAETYDEYRRRLDKNALNNRTKRQRESPKEKAVRQVRDAARQRLRRAMEDSNQRSERLRKLAERMRHVRKNESPEKKAERLARAAQRARERLQNETEEDRRIRLQKSSDYARRMRSSKSQSISECDSSLTDYEQKSMAVTYDNENSVLEGDMYQPQGYQLTIPLVKTEKIINNIPRVSQQQFFSVPSGFYVNNFHQPNEQNVVIQPVMTTLNIPQYHTQQRVIKVEQELQIPYEEEADYLENNNNCPEKMVEQLVTVEIIDVPTLPKRIKESDEQRLERLRVTAEKSRIRRQNETPEQREKRLHDLKTRARKRREEIKMNETEEERKLRLQTQAEYARSRRMKLNTLEGKEKIERKARELYAKIHDNSQEKPSVLKILEPIIEMNTSS